MSNLLIPDYLKYVDAQVAAESFLNDSNGNVFENREDLISALQRGNGHSSKFTEIQARAFVDQWEVLEQQSNTNTGFSGTLLKNSESNEYILSFRSTEFIDDSIRDSMATNTLEIFDTGFAWGQIRDMENWYRELSAPGGVLHQQNFSVTGYSLGGHLATAFNILRAEDGTQARVDNVVTFNGAGVGKIKRQDLTTALAEFNGLLESPGLLADRISIPNSKVENTFNDIKENLQNGSWSVSDAIDAWDGIRRHYEQITTFYMSSYTTRNNIKNWMAVDAALHEIQDMQDELERIQHLRKGGFGSDAYSSPRSWDAGDMAAMSLDYRLAVSLVSEYSFADNKWLQFFYGKKTPDKFANQSDVVAHTPIELFGSERSVSAVADSQFHYGTDVRVFVEDQPLFRGDGIEAPLVETVKNFAARSLVDDYGVNGFGDTHSIVLLVDSLNVQNLFWQLIEPGGQDVLAASMNSFFQATSFYTSDTEFINFAEQGSAEGDALDNVVNAMAHLFLGNEGQYDSLNGSPHGGTWAELSDFSRDRKQFTGRESFYRLIDDIQQSSAYEESMGSASISFLLNMDKADKPHPLTVHEMVTAAKDGLGNTSAIAVRYALLQGNPFVIDAEADLYQQHNANKRLELFDKETNPQGLTEQYLLDRAQWMYTLLTVNLDNTELQTNQDGLHLYQGFQPDLQHEFGHFIDRDNGYNLDFSESGQQHAGIVFLEEDGAIFNAGISAQTTDEYLSREGRYHVYGGNGDDVISTANGDDYIEAGSGADYISGGKGADKISGGQGRDSYWFHHGDGHDEITDRDGIIYYLGDGASEMLELEGGSRAADDTDWQSRYGLVSYQWSGSDGDDMKILFSSASDSILVKGFHNGDLGIHLLTLDSGEMITASAEDDRIYGDEESNSISAGAGDDVVFGKQGNDSISGGSGQDTLSGNSGNDTLRGGTGDDILYGVDGNDSLFGGKGNDRLIGGHGGDYLDGGDGRDVLYGWGMGSLYDPAGDGYDIIYGGEGDDSLFPGLGGGYLDGGPGNDSLSSSGNSILLGGPGDDYLREGNGSSQLIGGPGNDTYFIDPYLPDADNSIIEQPGEGNDSVIIRNVNQAVTYSLPENIEDVSINFSLGLTAVGNSLDNKISSGQGEDMLSGEAGQDTLHGGQDNDILIGGAGKDIYLFESGDGIDTIIDTGSNTLIFGQGFNYADFTLSLSGNMLSIMTGHEGDEVHVQTYQRSASESFPAVDRLVFANGAAYTMEQLMQTALLTEGSEENDVLFGTIHPERINGHAGNDYLDGGPGNDVLTDGPGDDILLGAEGNDQLTDGEGNDYLNGGPGDDVMDSGAGNDLLIGEEGSDRLFGGEGDDWLHGDNDMSAVEDHGDDVLRAGPGNDFLIGYAGADRLFGDSGDDRLYGDDGNDLLSGGPGRDDLVGGNGDDSYVFAPGDGSDRIFDTAGNNHVQLSGEISWQVLKLKRSGNDLQIGFHASQDQLLVTRWFEIENIQDISLHEGLVIDAAGISQLLDKPSSQQARNIKGSKASDSLFGSFGDDRISGRQGDDKLFGGAGNDKIKAGSGNDILFGDQGRDVLIAGKGDDGLYGGEGNDRLLGERGNDTLSGGHGNDRLFGGGGDDSYHFARGDGRDVIADTHGNDRVLLGDDIGIYDTWFSQAGKDLQLQLLGTDDQLLVRDWFSEESGVIEEFVLSDGSVLASQQLNQLISAMAAFNISEPAGLHASQLPQDDLHAAIAAAWQPAT